MRLETIDLSRIKTNEPELYFFDASRRALATCYRVADSSGLEMKEGSSRCILPLSGVVKRGFADRTMHFHEVVVRHLARKVGHDLPPPRAREFRRIEYSHLQNSMRI